MLQIQGDRTILYNDVTIECEAKIFSYIELTDLIMVQVLFKSETYEESNYGFQNIFCYNKIDGSLKWQVESKEGSPYVGIDLGIKKESGEVLYGERGGITREGEWGKIESCTYLTKPFQHGSDCISAQTFSSGFYSVDIETGKVTFLYRDK